MSKADSKHLVKCLKPFPAEITERVLALRAFVWDLYPSSNELIYDNYNAVAVGWSPTDRMGHIFCSMAIGRTSHNVHFGFLWGSKLSDPDKILIGQGNQYRYILVPDLKKFPKKYITKLVKEAFTNAMMKVKDKSQLTEGLTILKSVSAKKRTKAKAVMSRKSKAMSVKKTTK